MPRRYLELRQRRILDADLYVGRVLAEATGVEFQGVTEEDLANVLAEFSGYF